SHRSRWLADGWRFAPPGVRRSDAGERGVLAFKCNFSGDCSVEAMRRHWMAEPKAMFRKFARHVADLVGSPWAFLLAVVMIVVWAAVGPIFDFSDTWQLVV